MLQFLKSCFPCTCYRPKPQAISMQPRPTHSTPVYTVRSNSRDGSNSEGPDNQQMELSAKSEVAEGSVALANASNPAHLQAPLQTPPPQHPPGLLDRLPAEIRIVIYSELLLYSDVQPGKTLYPQILRTCKLVEKESKSILQRNNLKSTMLAEVCLHSKDPPTVRYNAGDARPLRQAELLFKEATTFKHVSSELRRAVIVLTLNKKIDIDRKDWTYNDYQLQVQLELYLLVVQILTSANIKDVHLKIRIDNDAPQASMETLVDLLCLPIRQLGPGVTLRVSGVDAAAEDRLLRRIPNTIHGPPAMLGKPALCRWLDVQNKVMELSDIMQTAGTYSSQVTVAFRSFCSNSLDISHVANESDYVRKESDLCDEADAALTKLRARYPWKKYRDEAERIIADAKLLSAGL